MIRQKQLQRCYKCAMYGHLVTKLHGRPVRQRMIGQQGCSKHRILGCLDSHSGQHGQCLSEAAALPSPQVSPCLSPPQIVMPCHVCACHAVFVRYQCSTSYDILNVSMTECHVSFTTFYRARLPMLNVAVT